jgi:hypothetical protein
MKATPSPLRHSGGAARALLSCRRGSPTACKAPYYRGHHRGHAVSCARSAASMTRFARAARRFDRPSRAASSARRAPPPGHRPACAGAGMGALAQAGRCRVLRQIILDTITFTMPRGPRGTSKQERAPRRGHRPLGARASRPLVPPACPRYADAGLPIAAAPPEPGHYGRPVPAGPPERGRLARFCNEPRARLPPASGGSRPTGARPSRPGARASRPLFTEPPPGSRRSRACRARRRVVADRRHAAETTIADAALRDAAVKRLRMDGRRGDGEPARSSSLVPRSSPLFS